MEKMLRQWQIDSLNKVKTISDGDRLLIQAPTGAGKNILIQEIAKYYFDMGKKVLLIVDRVELVNDLKNEANKRNLNYDIFTTQKTGRRKLIVGYDVVIIDEAHSKYPSVIKHIIEQNLTLIGLTATALSKGLGAIYGKYAYVPVSFQELVEQGILMSPKFIVSDALIDTSKLNKKSTGEYDLSDLVINKTVINKVNEMIELYLKPNAQCMILAPNQKEALNIKNSLKLESAIYTSDNKDNFDKFKEGSIPIVITVYALSKGFNHPNIQLILDCRPLLSIIEFIQGVGRCTRMMEGKTEAIYIDMCGNYYRFERKYLKWRINKNVKLNNKTKECIECGHDYFRSSIPPVCTECGNLTYIEMKCINTKCHIDFIYQDMKQCPGCNTNLITECNKCGEEVNICNRVCPCCKEVNFKQRKVKKNNLDIKYKDIDINKFKEAKVDYTKPELMTDKDLAYMILKTSFYLCVRKGKSIANVAPFYAYTIAKTFKQWHDIEISNMYRAFNKYSSKIDSGEHNIYLLERLINEHRKFRQKSL